MLSFLMKMASVGHCCIIAIITTHFTSLFVRKNVPLPKKKKKPLEELQNKAQIIEDISSILDKPVQPTEKYSAVWCAHPV